MHLGPTLMTSYDIEYQQRLYFQMRSHLQVPGVWTSTYLGAYNLAHNTSFDCYWVKRYSCAPISFLPQSPGIPIWALAGPFPITLYSLEFWSTKAVLCSLKPKTRFEGECFSPLLHNSLLEAYPRSEIVWFLFSSLSFLRTQTYVYRIPWKAKFETQTPVVSKIAPHFWHWSFVTV